MPSHSDRSPSIASSASSSRRKVFSRISSPFGSKSRSFSDIQIELDEPHRNFNPGDVVSGNVAFRVPKATRVTHITICLHGYVQVFKNPGQPIENFRSNSGYLGSGPGQKYGEYYGNGFASLFEDEVVLCGDGRLAEGAYQFNFELEFPDRDLPSSIDFERGTITYMLSATITRPTTISPIITKDKKLYFTERLDVAPLYPPKPRTITLEPISKRSRAKTQAQKLVSTTDKKSRKTDSAHQGSDPQRQSETSSAPSAQADSETPISPVPSEASFDSSAVSSSQVEFQNRVSPSSSDGTGTRASASKTSLAAAKVITATVESQAGGCLRGDYIPVKVNVSHTKPVRSMYGVIVTLYRQARVDMRPSIPLGPTEKGKVKFEDYYPKSRTGLGGLSLSGAGSSHVFRKDLSQNMAPLVINPETLTAEINLRVRVPENEFPTISTVPGAMISFKYYVEVVLDIQGRLAGQDRNMGSLSGSGLPNFGLNVEGGDMERSAFTPFGSTVIDTAPIRRDKSVVTCTFEVIVGTTDSERKRGKRKMVETIPESQTNGETDSQRTAQQHPQQQETQNVQSGQDWYYPVDYDPRWYDYQYWYYHGYDYANNDWSYGATQAGAYEQPPSAHVPLPPVQDESEMTEKERIQQAETRLLPSEPPLTNGDHAGEGASAPTAPYIAEDVENGYATEAVPSYPGSTSHSAATASTSTPTARQQQMSPAPEYVPPPADSSSATAAAAAAVGDDKAEMRRQELQAQASAPPVFTNGTENDEGKDVSSASTAAVPSAPTLAETDDQDGIHDSHGDAPAAAAALPRYER